MPPTNRMEETGSEYCIRVVENINNNDQNNVSPIWRIVYFRHIETISPLALLAISNASLVTNYYPNYAAILLVKVSMLMF